MRQLLGGSSAGKYAFYVFERKANNVTVLQLIISMMNRIMVGLPSSESREMILKTLLSKENAEDLDYKELATMTEGYTGSDLKVCTPTHGNGELIRIC